MNSLLPECDILATLIERLLNDPDYAMNFIETMNLICFNVYIYRDRFGDAFETSHVSNNIIKSFNSYFKTNDELQQLSLCFKHKYSSDDLSNKNFYKFYDELRIKLCNYVKYKYHLNINFTDTYQKSPIHQKVSVWNFIYSKLLARYKLQLKAHLLVDFNSQLSKCSIVSDYKSLANKLL